MRKPLVPVKDNAKDGELKGVSGCCHCNQFSNIWTNCLNRKQTIHFIQVSLYIAEHRQELEEEGGKDKAQVDYSDLLRPHFKSDQFHADFLGDWPSSMEGPQWS